MLKELLQKNYFELLGLTPDFELDQPQLQKNYLELQRKFHPDRFATESRVQQRMAVQLTAELNQARQVLLSKVQRAAYLLQLAGVDVPREQTIDDGEFLMQQMQWREQVAELNSAEDAKIQALRADIQQAHQACDAQYAAAYSAQDWDTARQALAKMQFFDKLERELKMQGARQ